jgi:hypothetical protein
MKKRRPLMKTLAVFIAVLLLLPQVAAAQGAPAQGAAAQGPAAQGAGDAKSFKQEELEQMVAPIALYPDSLLTQILMASTYPLEIVQAARWAKQNENLKGDGLAIELEKQNWDPSVKSLVNFPQILQMMNEKLDWTAKLGDAFLAQQKDVMDSVQKLRKKAQAEGNLKTTKEQTVVVQKETQTIIIEPANPQVVYVPAYNPTVVYGTWAYPAYPPPPPYYYPGYTAGAFLTGVAVGAAWGYAWGHSDWNHGDVNVNVNQNNTLNNNINRSNYQNKVTAQGGQGKWQHNPESRKGVAYRDQNTAQRYNKGGPANAQTRDAYRGRSDAGRQDPGRSDAGRQDPGRGDAGRQDPGRGDAGRQDPGRSDAGRQDPGRSDAGRQDQGRGDRSPSASTRDSGGQQRGSGGGLGGAETRQASDRSAFGGAGGSQTMDASSRGRESMSSSRASGAGSASSMSRGSGGGGGASSMSRGGGGGGASRGGGGGGRR